MFYTYEWAVSVYRAYHASLTPLLLLAYDGESLVGVASLATDNSQRSAMFLAHATADYCDFVSRPADRGGFLHAVFAYLRKVKIPTLTLANFPVDSATRNSLTSASQSCGYSMFSRPAYECAQIVLGGDDSRRLLKEDLGKHNGLRYKRKALAKIAPLSVDHLHSWDTIEPVLPQFMQAHIGRFVAMGKVSNVAFPERQLFLRELAKLLSAPGWMALSRMSVGDQPVAWNFGFRFLGSWFYYQPTFQTSLQRYSPGFCLLSKMVEDACDSSAIRVLDLGLGAEGFKEQFANTIRYTLHVSLATSAARCLREQVRYQAATVVKAVPRLESWIRSLLGRAS